MDKLIQYNKAKIEFEKLKKEIIDLISQEIRNIKDMPGVKREGKLKGFLIPSSMLSSESWSPRYYNNLYWKEKIIEQISKMNDLDRISKFFKDIVDSKKINGEKVNDNFISIIQSIITKYSL